MKMKLFLMKTRSGLHCGVGQGLSDIDLPIARESVSGYPVVPGTSIKGVLKEYFCDEMSDKEKFEAAFGLDPESREKNFASALSFGDGRLICLPVRSYFGTFAYITSPYSLSLLQDYLIQAGYLSAPLEIPVFPEETDFYRGAVVKDSVLLQKDLKDKLLLEDLDLLVYQKGDSAAEVWAEKIASMLYVGDNAQYGKELFKKRFVIVDDNVMSFFCETGLPVATRIRIEENGVVKDGALWYEEYVPPESIFLGHVLGVAQKVNGKEYNVDDMLSVVTSRPIDCQIGGNATTGRGLVTIQFA